MKTQTVTVTLIKTRREQLKSLRVELKQLVLQAKTERIESEKAKKELHQAKKMDRIRKLEVRLQLMKNPVGTQARKAARKPGVVTITKGN